MRKNLLVISIATALGFSLFSLILVQSSTDTLHVSLSDITNAHASSTLTLQEDMQQIVGRSLHSGIQRYRAASGDALLLNNQTGAVVALASYASDNKTETLETLTQPYEPGSVMKPLLAAAALDAKAISMNYRYYDKGQELVGEKIITNSKRYDPAEHTLQEIITLSLNTGAVNILKQMGGGSINEQAREIWHYYMTERYLFGKTTITTIGADSAGFVPATTMPNAASRYAQTAFGIGVTVSPAQITAAYAAITSGGQLKTPCLLKSVCAQNQSTHAVSPKTAADIQTLLIASLKANNAGVLHSGYAIGGKSGTAPIALSGGVYKIDVDNGTYIGFFGKDEVRYTLFMRLQEPNVEGYASAATASVWTITVNALLEQNALQ